MNVFEGKRWKYGSAGVYIVLMFMSFYCACYRIPVGVKYGVNLMVFVWACVVFFIYPQMERAWFCLRFFILFMAPYLMFWLWSIGIWITEFQEATYIIRGSQNIIYMLTNLLFISAALYLFDVDAVFYTLIGAALANFMVFVQVGIANGFPQLIAEYIELLVTFADDTGGAVRQMELHDMVFGWGAFLIYYAIHKEKKGYIKQIGLWLSIFFFTVAMKRIAVPAVAAAILVFYMLRHVPKKYLGIIVRGTAIFWMVAMLGYLAFIKNGGFVMLAEEYGINLMYRDVLYSYYQQFYEVSPQFLGRGIRFIYAYATSLPEGSGLATPAVHNVYMELYIETGFWCWCTWILYELSFRINRIIEWFGVEPAVALMAMNFYVFATYLTDNTSFYFPINVVYRMVIMAWCFEVQKKRDWRLLSIHELGKRREKT